MTGALHSPETVTAATDRAIPGVSWWQCRWCRSGNVTRHRTAAQEQAECLTHEATCPRRPSTAPAGQPARRLVSRLIGCLTGHR